MEGPVACMIRVQGALAPRWSDHLGGLQVVAPVGAAGDEAATELRGELPDQAALLGVLTTLYDLRHALLSVACTPAGPPAGDAPGGAADS
jgi:hypothetical protein